MTLFKVKIFSVSTELKPLAHTRFEMGLQAQPYIEVVNIVYFKSNLVQLQNSLYLF